MNAYLKHTIIAAAATAVCVWLVQEPRTAFADKETAEPAPRGGNAEAPAKPKPVTDAEVKTTVDKGIEWLISVQGENGGWGQDGGEKSFVRQGERLESSGNDVANTSLAVLALLRAGHSPNHGPHKEKIQKALRFIYAHIEKAPEEGLSITEVKSSQVQRKLGPYIDTFLAAMLLAELDGQMVDANSNKEVRVALGKCVGKIEKNQQKDGSWNYAGGWAPILGTSVAARALSVAKGKGVAVDAKVLAKVDDYTTDSLKPGATAGPSGADAGVKLYRVGQQAEQLSRSVTERSSEIAAIDKELKSPAARPADEVKRLEGKRDQLNQKQGQQQQQLAGLRKEVVREDVVRGFGSMGGEEFFSYLNISDTLRRSGGNEWTDWNAKIKAKLVALQNKDGTWAGHHCITGRVACTSSAILTLLAERGPAPEKK